MRNILFFIALFLLSFVLFIRHSQAAPFLVSDPTAQAVTHCGFLLDDDAKTVSVVESVTGGNRCKIDLASVSSGQHTAKATFINQLWGVESPPSVAITFTKGGVLTAPAGMKIEP